MNRFISQRPFALVLAAVATLALAAAAAPAAERPHVSQGTAQFVNANDFVGAGHATHLGQYTEVGSAAFSPTANPAVLRVDAWSIYTAANGDQLYATFTGHLNGLTGAITATVTYVGGTGRFEGATGSFTIERLFTPATREVTGTIEGSIYSGNGNH